MKLLITLLLILPLLASAQGNKPTAAFSVTTPSCQGSILTFTNKSTKVPPTKYKWHFGDGTTSADTNAVHTYAAAGTYTVSLVAYNQDSSDSVAQAIIVETPPTGANFKAGTLFQGKFHSGKSNDPSLSCVKDTLTFEITPPTAFPNSEYGSTWTIVSHSLKSAGGSSSSNYTFTAPSSSGNGVVVFTPTFTEANQVYILSVTISKQNSTCSDTTLTHHISVQSWPTANFRIIGQCLGESTIFFDSSIISPGIVIRKYEFGENGATSSSANTKYTYTQPGQYTVTYTVISSHGCTDVVKKNITISKNPIADFVTSSPFCAGNPIGFMDQSTGDSLTRYRWSFMEGSRTDTSNLKNTTHTFKTPGTHMVRLQVWTDKKCTAEISKSIVVMEGPKASFPQPVGCLNQDITFTGSSTGAVSHEWRFNDGKTFHTKDVTRKFDTAGLYTATFVATSASGCRDSMVRYVTFYPQPMADFTVDKECVGQSLYFTDISTVTNGAIIAQWEWTIDDSIMGPSKKMIMHTFSDTGLHKVFLRVKTNQGCEDTITKIVYIKPGPKADFVKPTSACTGRPVGFVNSSDSSNNSYAWDFGDGKTSTDKDPIHIYTKAGNFDVKLIVTDSNGCNNTITKTLTVSTGPIVDFDWCVDGKTVFFAAQEINHKNYIWHFGDPATGTASGVTASYTYQVPDTIYTVTLIATNAATCAGYHTRTIGIGVYDNSTITNCKTGIEDVSGNLLQLTVFPNPFSHKTMIEYELLKSQQVRVGVWDATGKQIAILSEGMQQAGMQQLILDANEHKLPAGIYMIRIETEGAVAAGQVLRLE